MTWRTVRQLDRWRPLLAVVLLWAAAAVPTPAAALPQPGDPLLVEVTSVEPVTSGPDDVLTVSGTVTNRSGSSIEDLRVLLRVSPDPLISRSEVASVTDLTTRRQGLAVESTESPVVPLLAPAGAAAFTISTPASALPLGINGVYAVFVEVRSDAGTYDTAFPLTWFPAPELLDPSRIVVMTPVRAGVDLGADSALLSNQLSSSLAPGGALHGLVHAGSAAADSGVPIAWLIDPAVTEAAERLAGGTAGFAPAVTDTGAARDAVSAWLERVEQGTAAAGSRTYITPYAEVDASGVLAAGMGNLLQQSIAAATPAAAGSLPTRSGLIAAPPGGTPSVDALLAYADAGATAVVLAEDAVPTRQRLNYTPSAVTSLQLPDGRELTAIIPDERLSQALRRPSTTLADRFRLQSAVLAEAAMVTLELPVSSRTILLLPPSDLAIPPEVYADILTALSAAPYTELVGLPALLDPGVPTVAREQRFDDDPDRLSTAYLAPIPGLEQRLGAFSTVTVDPLAFELDYRAALLRSASANWRDRIATGEALLASIGEDLAVEEQKVTTVSAGTVTFAGSAGSLPLTVSNGLDQAVEVGLLLRADPPVRLAYDPPGLVRVDSGRRVSIEIPVEVYGTGSLPVEVILTDREGRPFIAADDLVIRSTGASMVAAVVAITGAVALLILVVWRFRRKGAQQ